MKKYLQNISKVALMLLFNFHFFTFNSFAQTPQSFQYQAVARDASGNVLQSQSVIFKMSIISGVLPGTTEYVETHTVTTNTFGIVTIAVGSGTPASSNSFSDIDWSISPHFLMVEVDPNGSGSYINMGTTQLLSVPYALYAKQAENVQTYSGGIGITLNGSVFDAQTTTPLWNASQIQSISVSSTAPTTNQVLKYDGTSWSPTNDLNSGTPGGLNKTVQFNNSGSFDGDTAMVWDNTNKRLGVGITNPSGRMVVQGSLTASDTLPLFEVKNKTGQTIFVVYPDSVHIYVKDDGSKSNQGGFAVSGRNNSKATTNDFLRITPDSTRIYLNGDPTNSGFAIKGFNSSGGIANDDLFSVNSDSVKVFKSLLPPRMTQSQRNALAPMEGLLIFNTTTKRPNYFDGSAWANIDGTSAMTIGDTCMGGILAYIFQMEEQGYIPGETHGLIAALSDQSTGEQWANIAYVPTGATGMGLGEGNTNTSLIVSVQGPGSYAAQMCDDLVSGGFSDWYLPSVEELNKIYLNQAFISGLNSNGIYWSSTEFDSNNAMRQNFSSGMQDYSIKTDANHVRAVRTF